jgi:hypothetical protein
MVVSSSLGADGAIGEAFAPILLAGSIASGLTMKFSFENVNGVHTLVSEKVHLDEIAVTRTTIMWAKRRDVARGSRLDRLPIRNGADISAAISHPVSRTNHGD